MKPTEARLATPGCARGYRTPRRFSRSRDSPTGTDPARETAPETATMENGPLGRERGPAPGNKRLLLAAASAVGSACGSGSSNRVLYSNWMPDMRPRGIACHLRRPLRGPVGKAQLKGEFDSELRREGDADGRAGTEEVPQRARGHAQLVEACNRLRLGGRRIQAERRSIG